MSMKKAIVSKPLPRPSSGGNNLDLKKPTTMEVLAPDRSTGDDGFMSKSFSSAKKEIRLERTISAGTSNFDEYMKMKTKEIAERNAMTMDLGSTPKTPSEELKKLSSKPFDKKTKKPNEKGIASAEISTSRTAGLQSTALNSAEAGRDRGIDTAQIKFMGTVINNPINVLEENKLNFDNGLWRVAEKELPKTKKVAATTLATTSSIIKKETQKNQEKEKSIYEYDDGYEDDAPIENINMNFDNYNKEIEKLMKKRQAQEKMMKDFLTNVKNIKDENGKAIVPSNLDEIIQVAVDQQKAQNDLIENGLLQEGESVFDQSSNIDKLVDEMMENSEIKSQPSTDRMVIEKQKVRDLDKALAMAENKYRDKKKKDKLKKLNDSRDDMSEMSTDDMKSKLFITEYKKKNPRLSKAQLEDQKLQIEFDENQFKNEVLVEKEIPSSTEGMTEREITRLQAILSEIENEIETGEENSVKNSKLFSNPYASDLNVERLKEIDERLIVEFGYEPKKEDIFEDLPKDKFLREQAQERVIREKTEALTKKLLVIAEKDQNGELEDPEVISQLVEQIKLQENYADFLLTPPIPFDSLEDAAKKSNEILLSYNTNQLLADLQSMNTDYDKVGKEIKKLRDEMNKKIVAKETELQEKEKKRKMMEYLKEINSKQEQIGKIFVESVNAETELLNNLDRKLDELKNKDEEASTNELKSFLQEPEPEISQESSIPDKSIQDYDKEISEKIASMAFNLPALDDDKDKDEDTDDDGPGVDLEAIKQKYGITADDEDD